jgi:DNA-binding beta-propeller fold protein YncE
LPSLKYRMPPCQHWILINRIALHGYIKFGLVLSRVSARWARDSERSLSASATVGRCLEFYHPRGVAVASDGSVYVADTANHRMQKFTSEGVFVSKWGTRGSGDGEFRGPADVAVASDGSVYVADSHNDRIQKFSVGP